MESLHGQIFALYLFDVAEAADLQAAASVIGGSVRSKFAPKQATPAYVQYQQPPLWFEGAAVDFPSIDGFRVGFKLFDYGIISLRLTQGLQRLLVRVSHMPPMNLWRTKRSSDRLNRRAVRSPTG